MKTCSLPIDFGGKLRYEVVDTFETWVKPSGKEVTEMSIEKKGSNKAYTYTLKTSHLVKGEKQLKKKCISSSEYVEGR
jgi:hypothetical protein